MARYFQVHPVDPQPRAIGQAAAMLRDGGLIAYPTDSCYALGAALENHAGRDRILALRGLDDRHHFTLVCADFAQLGQLVIVDNATFRAIRAATPGRYTFILPATKEVPRRLLHPKKKTVGVRIPDHPVVKALLEQMGEPILSSTLLLPGHERAADRRVGDQGAPGPRRRRRHRLRRVRRRTDDGRRLLRRLPAGGP